jgi:outer membrane receptor for ferrienterochelin and colicin
VITVITKEQIEKSTGKTVAQILNEQAGITINGAQQCREACTNGFHERWAHRAVH